jgi:hypothetical protein
MQKTNEADDKGETLMPRAQRLPGVEKGFPDLEELGLQYAVLRDKRMATLKEEVELKKKIVAAMHEHTLTNYEVEGLQMTLVPGEEKLKVKADKDESEEDAA